MNKLALINEFLGQPPNASEHGYQIDHILEFCHWFMAALFVGWSAFFIFVLFRFRKSRQPVADHAGVKSGISTHLEFSVVLIEAVLLLGFAIPLWAKRVNEFPTSKDVVLIHVAGQQFNWNFHLPGPDGQFGHRDIYLVNNSNALGLDPKDPAAKDDIVTQGELHVPIDRPYVGLIQKGLDKQIILYWYQDRGRIIASEYSAKGFLVWDSMTKKRTDGSLVRISVPVGKSDEQAFAEGFEFMRDIFPLLGQYLPT